MWADKWLMQFNEKKCKSIQIGKSTSGFNYKMHGDINENTYQGNDLGLIISSDLKVLGLMHTQKLTKC